MVHASLFSGIGGPEVAAAMMGWQNAFHCEINPFGRAVLEYWFPDSKSYEDITKTDFREWRGKIDIITAGFPCQPFSYAGKRGGDSDARYLWPQAFRAIDEIRPTWFVGENVAGIATMVEAGTLTPMGWEGSLFGEVDGVHRFGLRQPFTIERICSDLEKIGYSVQPVLIPAAAVGAPHRRDRIFFLAFNASDSGNSRLESKRERKAEVHEIGFTANSDRQRREEPQQPRREENSTEEEAGLDDRTVRPRRDGDIAHAFCERLETAIQRGCDGKEGRDGSGRHAFKFADDAWTKGTWWDNFPTVSPVHAGNDGIPFRMDRASLPASMQPKSYRRSDPSKFNIGKWRTESLKAYGNAIVPQVMYRIFQAIEGANNNNQFSSKRRRNAPAADSGEN